MSGRVKNRVLGTGPGAIHVLDSRSPGPSGWRGFLGLEAALLLLPAGTATEGRVAQTVPGPGTATDATEPAEPLYGAMGCTLDAPGLLGTDPGHPTASTLWVAVELLGCEAGCRGVEGSREAVESGGSDGSRVRVAASLSDVLAPETTDPVAVDPPGRLGTAEDPEVLKILAKRDPRSNTATFMPCSWRGYRCCHHREVKDTKRWAAGLHPPPPAAIWTRRPWGGRSWSWGPGTQGA